MPLKPRMPSPTASQVADGLRYGRDGCPESSSWAAASSDFPSR
jgi:hypothetical protein